MKLLLANFFLLATLAVAASPRTSTTDTICHLRTSKSAPLFDLLDVNRDGKIDPFEALDQLLLLRQEAELTPQGLNKLHTDLQNERQAETRQILDDLDRNRNGKTELDEIEIEMMDFAESLDENNDGVLSMEEMTLANFDDMLMTKEEVLEEASAIFSELDKNSDDVLTQDEADGDLSWNQLREADSDSDNRVSKDELTTFFMVDNQPATFSINSESAKMAGVITSQTPGDVLRLIFENPSVRTIELVNVPGSLDDEANLRAAGYVRRFGISTSIQSSGVIASGGTDFFLAGRTRTIEKGAKLGIHSWGGSGEQGRDVPRDDPQHQLYLKYYRDMDIPESFYWRTLEAAPVNDIHWMTENELLEFKFRTTDILADDNTKQSETTTPPSRSPSTVIENDTATDKLTGEAKMMMNLLDINENGRLEKSELEGDSLEMLGELDNNNDQTIDATELMQIVEDQVDIQSKLMQIDTHQNTKRIVDLPEKIHRGLNKHFKKYTNLLAPNGNPIHFLAMDRWTDDRILRVRKVMAHFLSDVQDKQWGKKTKLANAMANNHAAMVLLNSQRDMDRVMPAIENLNLQFQDLRVDESPYEGEDDYLNHETRDAAWEEVFHLIHASGILVAMKPYDREIRKFARQAKQKHLWDFDEPNMPGSHFEYIICVFDNYIDLWKTKPNLIEGNRIGQQPKEFSFGSEYRARDRSSTKDADPDGFSLVEKFNPPHIAYSADLPETFKGEFSIDPESGHRYADKARHLRNVTAHGSNPIKLIGNQSNNRLVGNLADNTLKGMGGDDSLFGGRGMDTAVFRGTRSQYTILQSGELTQVQDSMVNRDGYDVLSSIEWLQFSDEKFKLN